MIKKLSDDEIVDVCIPDIIEGNQKLSRSIFYMLYQIEKSGLAEAIIHLDEELTKWWTVVMRQYEASLVEEKAIFKLTTLIQENFTEKEIDLIANFKSFKIDKTKSKK